MTFRQSLSSRREKYQSSYHIHSTSSSFYFYLLYATKTKIYVVNHELKLFYYEIDRTVLLVVVQQVCTLVDLY